jgi:hypothetical protein
VIPSEQAPPPVAPTPNIAAHAERSRLEREIAMARGAMLELEQGLDQLEESNGPTERYAVSAALYAAQQRINTVLFAAHRDYQPWPLTPVNLFSADAIGDVNDPHPEY